MKPETEAIDEGTRAEHAVMPSEPARQVGERLGWLGDDEHHGFGRRPEN